MTLCLDTNVVIDLMRRRTPQIRQRWREAQTEGAEFKLSSIVLSELLVGPELSDRPALQRERLDAVLSGVTVEPWTAGDAAVTASVRANLRRRGENIGAYDLLVAGQALARDWTVVTGNWREFARVEGLKVLDWSDASGPVTG